MNEITKLDHFMQTTWQSLTEGGTLKQVLDEISQSFELGIFVLDVNSSVLLYAASSSLRQYFPDLYDSGDDMLCYPTNSTAPWFFSPGLHISLERQLAAPEVEGACYTAAYPIASEGQLMSVLVIKYKEEKLLSTVEAISRTLIKLCQHYLLERRGKLPANKNSINSDFAKHLLLYTDDSISPLSSSDTMFGIQYRAFLGSEKMKSFHAPFVIASIEDVGGDSENRLSMLTQQFEDRFSKTFSVISGNRIYILFFDFNERNAEEFCDFIQKYRVYAGISDPFDSIGDRKNYKLQAKECLKLALCSGKPPELYKYSDCYGDIIIKNAADRLGPAALKLTEVDKIGRVASELGGIYLDTLEQYIKCFCKPSAAAKALFIDRGTLSYRIKKISEIINIECGSKEEADNIYASLLIYRLMGK